jgi:hypothetical protein
MHKIFKYEELEIVITNEYSKEYDKYFEDIGYNFKLLKIENQNKHIILCIHDDRIIYFNILNYINEGVAIFKTVLGYNYINNFNNYDILKLILQSIKAIWPKILSIQDISKIHPFDNFNPLSECSNIESTKTVYYNELGTYEINKLIGKTRNIIKKASNLINVVAQSNKNEFVAYYNKFLISKGFDKKYLINKEIELIENLDVFIGFDNKQNTILGGICCLKRKTTIDYHYSFNTSVGNKFACNSLILHKINEFYKIKNYDKFYLGGGVSNSLDDPLALFKKRNSISDIKFIISTTIYGL